MKSALKRTFAYKIMRSYRAGERLLNDEFYKEAIIKGRLETEKQTSRTAIINFLLSKLKRETTYLEIGVRNPADNFNHINSNTKYSVDPGIEFKKNPVDFQLTSDDFFAKLDSNEILNNEIRFDVIFIDGLHLAEQVNRDIINALRYIKEDGFVVLHDCNPPTEYHARENYNYNHTPAGAYWNGTTWKAFLKWRFNKSLYSCCINSDWGVGILSKKHLLGSSIEPTNQFYEFDLLDKNRIEYLNLIEFDDLKKILQ